MDQIQAIVGVIGRAHGIRGEVMVEPRTDVPELRFAEGAEVISEDGKRGFTVAAMRLQQGRMIVSFEGIDDRTKAESIRGTVLQAFVDNAETPDDPEEFYDRHLIGLRVLNAAGEQAGTIESIDHAGSQDLLVVATSSGKRLIPFVEPLVPVVDMKEGFVQIADVHGLLDDDAEIAQ
ncbi:MAG: ribosome maturation factor RimM [Propionibacteriaceae bacterium]